MQFGIWVFAIVQAQEESQCNACIPTRFIWRRPPPALLPLDTLFVGLRVLCFNVMFMHHFAQRGPFGKSNCDSSSQLLSQQQNQETKSEKLT